MTGILTFIDDSPALLLLLWPLFLLILLITTLILIYVWVTRFLRLKNEQNDLLREFIDKWDKKQS